MLLVKHLLLPVVLVFAFLVSAGRICGSGPVEVMTTAEPSVLTPGQDFELVVKLRIAAKWHIYGSAGGPQGQQATQLKLRLPSGIAAVGDWIAPKPESMWDGRDVEIYTGEQTFRQKLKIMSAVPEPVIRVVISYQACTTELCAAPEVEETSVALSIRTGTAWPDDPDLAWEELLKKCDSSLSKEEQEALAKAPLHEQLAIHEYRRRKIADLAAAYYDAFPSPKHRQDARAVFFSNMADPYFFIGFPATPDGARDWRRKEWAEYSNAQPLDLAAKSAWLRKSEAMVSDVLASAIATRAEKEDVEWKQFGRNFRLATLEFQIFGRQVDWEPFFAQFEIYAVKYADLDKLGTRAEDYLGALKNANPEIAATYWRRLLKNTDKHSQAPGTKALRSTAAKAVELIDSAAEGGELKLVKFTAVDGREIDLSGMRGHVVLLDFWAMWCGPCVAELPALKVIHQKYHDQGFEIIGVSADGGDKAKLESFLKEKGCTWPQHFDGKGTANYFTRLFNITAWPTSYLIGKDGKVIGIDIRGAALEPAIRKALGLAPLD